MTNTVQPQKKLQKLKRITGIFARRIYISLPVSFNAKNHLKNFIFIAFGRLLRSTNSYKAWRHTFRANGMPHITAPSPTQSDHQILSSTLKQYVETILTLPHAADSNYVPLTDHPADASKIGARAIAFYLPQFHPIPENDQWWGRGFTEWTNVSKAVPQFVGHYQPRLPGELGFYDLRVVDVMRRQAELAKLYGLAGFCFYYYWFDGRRLLERPLQQLLDSDIDLPFCICWANENWTRRWDGMDQDILIAQHYSPEDDLAFIRSLIPMLLDPRYIRVDGRPLIVLYRPSLLPDAAATLNRWRDHCHLVGVGEIFLCMAQFDQLDPRPDGFDAAVEFPPHKLGHGIPPINDDLEIVNPNYEGYIIDYENIVNRANQEPHPSFPMIRGVFPSWDNEARKPGRGYTAANATPSKYRAWLRSAVSYAQKNPIRGERLVFINAWNEWAEGAYLEPDRRYGYAYLNATRQALQLPTTYGIKPSNTILVVIHAFYPDLLPEIFAYLKIWHHPFRLIITTVIEQEAGVQHALENAAISATVLARTNRGRDILPFLNILYDQPDEAQIILKLHTGRSLHRQDGDGLWRKDILRKLIDPAQADKIIAAFQKVPDLGLVAPTGHILAISSCVNADLETVGTLVERMGGDSINPNDELFAAGSMFYARSDALRPIRDLHLPSSEFEEESGQTDGTLADVIELCFGLASWQSGHFVAESNAPEESAYRFPK
jgi:lipopolysaccharide biosynthesis protein